MSAALLFVIAAQIEFALILNQAESHLIEPAASAQHVAREAFMRREINGHVERVPKCFQRQHVAIGIKTARHSIDAKQASLFHVDAQRFALSAPENAKA